MKNLILDLINNSNTLLAVREKLIFNCGFQTYHDVDTDATGFWVKKEVLPADICYIGLHVNPGQGVYLKIDPRIDYKRSADIMARSIKYKTFEGTPSFEDIMGQIDQFMKEIYCEGWDK